MAAEDVYAIKVDTDEAKKKIKELQDELDKLERTRKIDIEFTKKYGGGGRDGGAPSMETPTSATVDRDLERRYKRESLIYYRDFHTNTSLAKTRGGFTGGQELQNMFKGLGGAGGIFSSLFLGSAFKLLTGQSGRRDNEFTRSMAGAASGGALFNAGRSLGRKLAGGGAAEGAEAATAGEEVAAESSITSLLGKASVITAIAGAAVSASYFAASRGAARGKYAGGIGGTVGGVSATELGFDRWIEPKNVMDSMAQAKFDITSPAYTAERILGIKPGGSPEDMAAQTTMAVARQLKSFGKQNEQTMLTMAHARGFGALGFSDADLIRLYGASDKDLADAAKKAKKDAPSYDLTKDQVRLLQDQVQWMKEWATEGETLVEKGAALDTQIAELVKNGMPGFMSGLKNLGGELLGLLPSFDTLNKEVKTLGGEFGDWIKKFGLPDPTFNAPVQRSPETGEPLRGRGAGAPAGIRGRGRGTESSISPLGSGTGQVGSEIDAKWVNLRADNPADLAKINAYMKEGGVKANAAFIAWCAAWVNAQLAHEGIKGSGGLNVSSFRRWGSPETGAEAHRGDVMIVYGGKHVGRFTGERRGGLYGFYSGNAGEPGEPAPNPGRSQWGGTKLQWLSPSDIDEFRRAPAPSQKKAPDKTSMINMKLFQGIDKQMAIKIDNPAGASYQVSGGMLGAAQGNYGSG